jgi:hypothetical protein
MCKKIHHALGGGGMVANVGGTVFKRMGAPGRRAGVSCLLGAHLWLCLCLYHTMLVTWTPFTASHAPSRPFLASERSRARF